LPPGYPKSSKAADGYFWTEVQIVERIQREEESGEAVNAYKNITKQPENWPAEVTFPQGGKLMYPCWLIKSPDEYKTGTQSLAHFAKLGCLVGFSKEYWEASLLSRGKTGRI